MKEERIMSVRSNDVMEYLEQMRGLKYPLTIRVKGMKDEATYTVYSRRQLLDYASSPGIRNSHVTQFSRGKHGYYIDIQRKRGMEISDNVLKGVRNKAELTKEQAFELCDALLGISKEALSA